MTAARVGHQVVTVADIDERERILRSGNRASALPRPGTSEGRQLRRWLTQLVTAERVVALENADTQPIPDIGEILPDMSARLEIGSIAAAVLTTYAGRAAYARVTAGIEIGDTEIVAYHRRNPARFAARRCGDLDFAQARPLIAAHLIGAARRRAFRRWLDARCAELVDLAPGYEHPGDPRQPDNTHRH